MKLTDANSGTVIELPATSIIGIKEYPAGQTWVTTTDPVQPVVQPTESVEEVERMRKEELSR